MFRVALDNGHRVVAQTAIDPRFQLVKPRARRQGDGGDLAYDLGRGRITQTDEDDGEAQT